MVADGATGGRRQINAIRYLSRKERQVPPEWLNPMFLVRNPPLD
jgi:hypothetical protein